MKKDTLIVTSGRHPEACFGIVNPPVYHASTVTFPTVAALEKATADPYHGVYYGRHGTPTTFALEEAMAELEGGYRSIAFASGLAAIAAVMMAFVRGGDHVLVADTVYGPSRRFADTVLARFGVETTYYDPMIDAGIAALIRPNTRLVYMESPGSLTFEVQDVPAIAAAARERGVVSVIDNTWATPLFFRAFDHGADVSIHAATKYVVGHSDAMLGVVTTNEETYLKVRSSAANLGGCAAPDDCYLGQRGLRTLGVRLRQHQETALTLARWLAAREEVERILHPAFPGHPGHDTWLRDFSGASGLFGVVLKPFAKQAVVAMLDGLELYAMGYSWGGYESLILPTRPEKLRSATRWSASGPCLRIHAGLEDPSDLIADLERGFSRLNAAAAVDADG